MGSSNQESDEEEPYIPPECLEQCPEQHNPTHVGFPPYVYPPEFELQIFNSMQERDMDHLMSVQLEKLTKLLEFLKKTRKLDGEPSRE